MYLTLKFFINGRPIGSGVRRGIERVLTVVGNLPEKYKVSRVFRVSILLPPGEETVRIGAIVYDGERLKSNLAEVTILRRLTKADLAKAGGDLYVLCIGVSKYQDERLNLKFADEDAKEFGDFFSGQQGCLYRSVFVKVLTDEQATATAIRGALFELIERLKPTDKVVLLFAGHGVRDEQFNYYFAVHDFDVNKISDTGLPTRTFEALLSSVQAKQIFAFLDTCHAGGVLGSSLPKDKANHSLCDRR